MTDKPEETAVLLNKAYNAFDNEEYDSARSIFEEIASMFPADSPPGVAAATYLRHLHPDNLELLHRLASANEDQDEALRREALARGLEFDLSGTPLTEDFAPLSSVPPVLPDASTDDAAQDELEDDDEFLPIVEDRSEEWLDEARKALEQGDYDRARERFAQVYAAVENTSVHKEAEQALHKLEPENLALLQSLAAEQNPEKQVTLIKEALARGINQDLQNNNLPERAEKIQKTIFAEADKKAREALNAGQTAVEQGDLEKARELCQQARQVPNLSPDMQAQVAHCLLEIEKREEAFARASDLLQTADKLMRGDNPDYAAAQERVDEARQFADQHPDLGRLHEQAQAGVAYVEDIRENLRLGHELLDDNPEKAQIYFTNAQQAADERRLLDLLDGANRALQQTKSVLDQRAADYRDFAEKGEKSFQAGDFAEARKYLDDAIRFAPSGTDTTKLKQRLDKIYGRLEVDELKKASRDNIFTRKDFELAIRQLRQAHGLSPSDPEIVALITEATELRGEARTVRQTIGLRRVPYDSPTAMRASEGLDKLFEGDELASIQRQIPELYWHQAVSDLRDRVQQDVLAMVQIGNLPIATQQGKSIYREWQDYFETELRRFSHNPTLEARLLILQSQINDIEEAQAQANMVAAQTAEIERAFQQQQDAQAINTGRRAWEELQKAPPRLDYALDYHRRKLIHALAFPIRRLAQQYHDQLEPSLVNTRSYLLTSRLSDAEDELEKNHRLANELQKLKELYDALSPSDDDDLERWRAGWTITAVWEEQERLRQRVDEELRWQSWLEEATQAANQARYPDAKLSLQRIFDENSDFENALTLKEQISEAETHYKAMQSALDEEPPNYEGSLHALRAIEYQLGQSHWITAKLQEVQQARQTYQTARNAVTYAQDYLDAGAYERAERSAQQIITQYPQFPDVQADAQQIENKAADNRKISENLTEWRHEAQTALRKGELEDAFALAQRVLDAHPEDMRMKRVQEQAQKAQALREEANEFRELNTIQGYRDAELKLTEALRFAYDSDELKSLRDEVRDKRTRRQGPVSSKKDAERAIKNKKWDTALKTILAALSDSHDHPDIARDLEQMQDDVVEALRSQISRTVNNKEATVKDLEDELDRWKLLDEHNLHDSVTSGLDYELSRQLLLTRARDDLQVNKVNEVIKTLRVYEDEYGGDREFSEIYDTARFASKLQEAREYLYPEPVDVHRYEQAIAAVQVANKFRGLITSPRKWETLAQLGDDQNSKHWENELRQWLTILLTRQAIDSGDLAQARARLETVTHTQEAQFLRLEVEQIETKMGKAVKWDNSLEDIENAVHLLDSLLPPTRTPAYPSAETLRERILSTLHERAVNWVKNGDHDQLARAIVIYDLLLTFNPPNLPAIQEERNRADRQMKYNLRLLSGQVREALGNADLTRERCQSLLDEVEKVPPEWRKDFTALKTVHDDLQTRLGDIDRVDGLVQQAEHLLDEVHETNDYGRVKSILDTAVQVNPNIFARRSDIGRMNYLITEHKEKRYRIETQLQPRYKVAQDVVRLTFRPPSSAIDSYVWDQAKRHLEQLRLDANQEPTLPHSLVEETGEVYNYVNWGIAWLSTASDFNREWKYADPDNLYGLRTWPDKSAEDPLDKELGDYEQAKSNLGKMGDSVVQAIEQQSQATQIQDKARAIVEKASQVEDYEIASQEFRKAIDSYSDGIRLLENLPVADSRWARELNEKALKFKKDDLGKPWQGAIQAKDLADQSYKNIEDARQNAFDAERQCSDTDIDCMQIAINQWKELQKELPNSNREAVRHINDLEAKIRKREAVIRVKWRNLAIGGVIIVILSVLAFMYFSESGIFTPPPRPTATPTLTPSPVPTGTTAPTGTPTITPSPTVTPLPTDTATPTLTPFPTAVPTAEPIVCSVTTRSWVRDKPGIQQGVGLGIVPGGSGVTWIETVIYEGEEWYRVRFITEGSDQEQTGFIDPNFVNCPGLD